jgi:hypothetical protein
LHTAAGEGDRGEEAGEGDDPQATAATAVIAARAALTRGCIGDEQSQHAGPAAGYDLVAGSVDFEARPFVVLISWKVRRIQLEVG